MSAALFQTETDNELVVAESSGGRTSYANAGKTGGAASNWRWIRSLRWTGA